MDLKWDFENWDLVVTDNDLMLCDGVDEVIQNVQFRFSVPYFSWAGDFLMGSKITTYINMPDTPINRAAVKNEIINVLRREPLIVDFEIEETESGYEVHIYTEVEEKIVRLNV